MIGFLETLINLILRIYDWFIFWEILLDFQRGTMLRLGKYNRMAEPGWNWRLPFGLEDILIVNVVPGATDLPTQAIVSADGMQVVIEVVILWGVSSPRKFLLEVENAASVLSEAAQGTIFDVSSTYTWKELQNGNLNVQLTEAIKDRARKWGVRIISVQVTSMSKMSLKDGCLRISQPTQMVSG